ncbi:MAG: flavodoxin family protein [Bacteroidales bacterium]|nr:flavodoxin family protein [Bacteroidales bacterium]
MKACIIYNSKQGTTKAYAEAIGNLLKEKGTDCEIFSIEDYKEDSLKKADLVLLGAWTHGLMIFAQHPERAWKKFAESMPAIHGKKVGLFTTYKLATGSLFRKMESCLGGKIDDVQLVMKSRSKALTPENIKQVEEFLA